MSRIAMIGGVAVLVTSLVSGVQAQNWRPPSYSPYAPGAIVPVPAPGPGCPAPIVPPAAAPGTWPGAAPSTTPGTSPSTTPGTTPSTTPGAAPSTPPGTVPGTDAAATAPGAGDTAGSAAGEAGSDALASAAPGMVGDLGYRGVASLNTSSSGRGGSSLSPSSPSSSGRFPLGGQGSFKISDNDSPAPVDRVFLSYNYFNNANTFGGNNFGMHRATLGGEMTFLDARASAEVRIPVQVNDGSGGGYLDGLTDITAVFKYAFYKDCDGNILSGGMAVTAPTGRDITLSDGTNIHGWLIQPWVGARFICGDFYAINFTSLVAPTETRDAAFVAEDFGVGYRLWHAGDNSDRVLTSVIPTIEGHLNVPINHPGVSNTGLVGFEDQFTVTAGVHLGLCNRAFLTLAGALPVTGPRPESYELIAQFNLQF